MHYVGGCVFLLQNGIRDVELLNHSLGSLAMSSRACQEANSAQRFRYFFVDFCEMDSQRERPDSVRS